MLSITKKSVALMSAVTLLGLTGCGNTNEKVQSGMQAISELQYENALTLFEEAQAASENERLIARGRGIAYMGLTDYENAIACFTESLKASDGFLEAVDYDLNFYLAAAYTKNGQYAEAETVYDAILALKNDEDAYFLRGNARIAQDKFDLAKEDFDRVASMDPNNFDRLIEIYEIMAAAGYRVAGEEYLQNALTNGGSKLDSFDSGRIYFYLGEYQKAAAELEKSREKGGADSYLYLGKSYEATGDFNYAASVYSSYLAKDTSDARIYNQLGLCELARGEYAQALDSFQSGMKIEDNRVMQSLSFNEIVAYEYLGEYQKAAVLLENYLKSYPDDETAKREQVFLSTR